MILVVSSYAIGHPRDCLWRREELQLRAPLPMTRFHFTSIKGEMQEFGLARHERSTYWLARAYVLVQALKEATAM
jgi:hypothetical protein